jgi:hypothetical protein
MKLQGWFSILLGVTYLGVFHLWRAVSSPWIVISGPGVSACLGVLLVVAAKRHEASVSTFAPPRSRSFSLVIASGACGLLAALGAVKGRD